MSDTFDNAEEFLSSLEGIKDPVKTDTKDYQQDLYKKWFRSKTQSGFLAIRPWNEALKMKIDIGKTSSEGKLASSTAVFVDTIDFAAYLRSIANLTAATNYPANERMGVPTNEGFVSYGGTTIDEAVEVAKIVEATGNVDYINTSIGVATASLFMIEASMHIPPGYATFISSAIRKAVDLPVVGVGRFKDPLQAERALAEGHCDLVGIVRGQIADADFAAKARAGATDDIRLCLSCNQECVGRMGLNRWLGCIENPRTGRENEWRVNDHLAITAKPKKVMIAGAGPAGLQAAIAAARKGHQVTVYEKETVAGGQVRIAASVPNRAEFGDMIRNQLTECARLGVTIIYGSGVWPGLIDEQKPDHVIVATGAEPSRPWWVADPDQDESSLRVCDVRSILDGSAPMGGPQSGDNVVIVDEIGFHHATSTAEVLADRGCLVEIVTPGMVVGQDLGITLDMENWWIRAGAKGIVQTTDLVPMGFANGELTLLHHPTGINQTRHPEWVVLAVPPNPVEWLYNDLKNAGISVERVGDCVAPRRAHAAVVDGERAGSSV